MAVLGYMGRSPVCIDDARGSLEMGWLDGGALYVGATGEVSSELGVEGAARLTVMFADAVDVRCFVDVEEPTEVDFTAATAFLRVFLSKEEQLRSVLLLVRPSAVEAMQRILGDLFEGCLEVTADARSFHHRAGVGRDDRANAVLSPRLARAATLWGSPHP